MHKIVSHTPSAKKNYFIRLQGRANACRQKEKIRVRQEVDRTDRRREISKRGLPDTLGVAGKRVLGFEGDGALRGGGA
jgi:hypothetical protein